jgi:hypothetical protein
LLSALAQSADEGKGRGNISWRYLEKLVKIDEVPFPNPSARLLGPQTLSPRGLPYLALRRQRDKAIYADFHAIMGRLAVINRWRRAYLRSGIDAVLAGTPARGPGRWWVAMIVRWVITFAPRDFGFARSRWSCDAVAIMLREDHGVQASRETVRRRLGESDLVGAGPARWSAAATRSGPPS